LNIKCPECGNKGSTQLDSDAFEVRGMYERKPVRKCARCGAGLFVLFPKRVKVIPPDLWRQMEASWEREFGKP
jgi:ribosomal protein S27AE